jgi:FlaA1/EpsC-like NDP-sugar epimerase
MRVFSLKNIKISLVIAVDILCAILSFWFSFLLSSDKSSNLSFYELWTSSIVCAFIAILVLGANGIYKTIYRYVGVEFFILLFRCIFWYFIVALSLSWIVSINQKFSLLFIQSLLFLFLLFISRLLASSLSLKIKNLELTEQGLKNTLIYGAGVAGNQLAKSISENFGYKLKGFVDDDPFLQGKNINTIPIYHSSEIGLIIRKENISEIFLALPSISTARYREILNQLSKFKVHLRTLPKLSELPTGKVGFKDVKNIKIEDLLLRSAVQPNQRLMEKNITSKVVLVTGAAGSVGSELCRQILRMRPSKLLILDNSEYQLYQLTSNLDLEANSLGVELCPLLASVSDKDLINKIIQKWMPFSLYHAAAYKHVSIVEANLSFSIKNNVFGTLYVAQAALENGVKNFVLISSDKAVRPSSAMGASKRISEIILQSLSGMHSHSKEKTCFSMVRFGNVLGSSGSVVPLFKKQIEVGGPITLSHPDVTRYFMTISEAAQLVIQAGAMAKGGDVFLLDMGEPIKIGKLAENMIAFSGLSVKNEENPDGDIEIIISGLKPGEKLHEEMLIKDSRFNTDHPKIMMAKEEFISWNYLGELLLKLQVALDGYDATEIITVIKSIVPEYSPDKIISDQIDC